MQIRIADLISNKVIKIDADEDTTIGELIDAIKEVLRLPDNYLYSLVYGNQELGPDTHDMTLKEIGIRDGDELQILGRPQGG